MSIRFRRFAAVAIVVTFSLVTTALADGVLPVTRCKPLRFTTDADGAVTAMTLEAADPSAQLRLAKLAVEKPGLRVVLRHYGSPEVEATLHPVAGDPSEVEVRFTEPWAFESAPVNAGAGGAFVFLRSADWGGAR